MTRGPPRSSIPEAEASVIEDSSSLGARVTRSRSRELGLAPDPVPVPAPAPAKRKVERQKVPGPGTPKRRKKKGAAGSEDSQEAEQIITPAGPGPETLGAAAEAAGSTAVTTPMQRPRIPPYPKNGSLRARSKWVSELHRIVKIRALRASEIRDTPPCTLQYDPPACDDVLSSALNKVVLNAGRSIVSIVSTMIDGTLDCTGIVVGWDERTKRAKILTSSAAVCANGRLLDPKPKLLVQLPNRATSEGCLVFFNAHYNIALLETVSDSTLQIASFGSGPNYEQEIFALARDDECSLMATSGTVLCMESPDYLTYNYHMFVSCELAEAGYGGPVIDYDGNVVGMAFGIGSNSAMIAISTVLTCIEMWTKFSRIARPVLDMSLRTVEMQDISLQDKLDLEHNINKGYIVDLQHNASVARGRLGISRGDVIVSFDGHYRSTLPQLEDFLLSLGWKVIESIDSSRMVDLELEVYDPVGRARKHITFPLKFSDASERVYF